MSIRTPHRWIPWLAIAALPACDLLVGANFDVDLRPLDGGTSLDAGRDATGDRLDAGAGDAVIDASLDVIIDVNVRPDVPSSGDARDVVDDGVSSDTRFPDVGTDVDGGLRPTILNGGFIYLGVPNPQPSPIELRGQIISNSIVRGTTPGGISIQGRFQ